MLHHIKELPSNVFAVSTTEPVKEGEIATYLIPGLEAVQREHGEIRFLLLLHTPLSDLSATGWFYQLIDALSQYPSLVKLALVTDQPHAKKEINTLFNKLPRKTSVKLFHFEEFGAAMHWIERKQNLLPSLTYLFLTGISCYFLFKWAYERKLIQLGHEIRFTN